jgi:hypothetical protein
LEHGRENSDQFERKLKEQYSVILTLKSEIEQSLQSIKNTESQVEVVSENVKIAEQDIETRKLSITTFASNIDEHKIAIEAIESQAKKIINQDSKIKNMIEQAEAALQLNSAQGISGAFASQYTLANNNKILYGWAAGAFGFVIGAIWLTVALITETRLKVPNMEINPLIAQYPWIILVGRAVSVSICLSAAAFCARQYTKQKNIAEDYAYKSVLSKSIVAFTKEIRKVDEEKATEYLTTVLEEIHKDPLRIKLTKADSLSTIDFKALGESIASALNRQKKEK